mmetsp:Transcript_69417/g.212789  ORF Transcript_69417/g.212789 Transcript_69417/m.212789 type:complete len:552 (-) Transcript_69417:215-1870(-)
MTSTRPASPFSGSGLSSSLASATTRSTLVLLASSAAAASAAAATATPTTPTSPNTSAAEASKDAKRGVEPGLYRMFNRCQRKYLRAEPMYFDKNQWGNFARVRFVKREECDGDARAYCAWDFRRASRRSDRFYIANVGAKSFADTHGAEAWVWQMPGGDSCSLGRNPANLRWDVTTRGDYTPGTRSPAYRIGRGSYDLDWYSVSDGLSQDSGVACGEPFEWELQRVEAGSSRVERANCTDRGPSRAVAMTPTTTTTTTGAPGAMPIILLGTSGPALAVAFVLCFIVVRLSQKMRKPATSLHWSQSGLGAQYLTPTSRCRDPRNRHHIIEPWKWCVSAQQLEGLLWDVKVMYPDEDPNVYTVVQNMIKPRTVDAGESWALQQNPMGLVATDFVTHTWGEGMKQFCESILDVHPQGGLWICFLANPQTWPGEDLETLLGMNPWQSPFAIALKQANRVIAVRNHNVNLYTRLWCVFELYAAHTFEVPLEVVGPKQVEAPTENLGLNATCSSDGDKVRLTMAMERKRQEIALWVQDVLANEALPLANPSNFATFD